MPDKVTFAYLHPGEVRDEFCESRIGLFLADLTGPQRLFSHRWGLNKKECGAAGIVDGRNMFAQTMLDNDVDWLFMVDADMEFQPDAMERLLKAADVERRPVMGGLAFAHKTDGVTKSGVQKFRPAPTLYRFVELEDEVGFTPWFDYPANSMVPVDATGAAIVLIHRTVFEKIHAKYGPVWFDTIRHPKGANFSEDLAFCVRAAGSGVPIHVHTGVRTVHHKGHVKWDECAYHEWRAANVNSVEQQEAVA